MSYDAQWFEQKELSGSGVGVQRYIEYIENVQHLRK